MVGKTGKGKDFAADWLVGTQKKGTSRRKRGDPGHEKGIE